MTAGCVAVQPRPSQMPLAAPGASAPAIEGREWRGVTIDGAAVIPTGRPVSLRLSGDQANGSGGCNAFFGPYEHLGNGRIRLGPFGSTRMGCMGGGIDEQERRYLGLLTGTMTYRLNAAGALVLTAADGRSVSFR